MDPVTSAAPAAQARHRHLAPVTTVARPGAGAGRFARATHTDGVRLVDAEPSLAEGLSPEELDFARRHLVVPAISIAPGRWEPGAELGEAMAVLVLDGMLLRDGITAGRPDVLCFGPGDFIDPRLLVDPSGTWKVLDAAEVALLDSRVVAVARRCPELFGRLVQRLFDGHAEQHVLAAVRSLPRVEERILALLGHHASRWGRVTRDGITLVFPVTHELLGRLVGARRPTVSLALSELRDQRLLGRLPDGRWLLPAGADEDVAPAA